MCFERVRSRFRAFVQKRGNVVDMGVGIIIGGAFTTVVMSLVTDIVTPPLGLFFTGRSLDNWFIVIRHGHTKGARYNTPEEAIADGAVTENVGRFLNHVIQFFIIAWILFWLVYFYERSQEKIKQREQELGIEPPGDTTSCPWCQSEVSKKAIKCMYCTSMIREKPPEAESDQQPQRPTQQLIDVQ